MAAVEIWNVAMGYVTSTRGARLHLDINGLAYCGSGSGRIATRRSLRGDDAPIVCRRCAAAVRDRLVVVISRHSRLTSQGRDPSGMNAAIVRACNGVIDGITTADEAARETRMIASIRATMRAAAVPAVSMSTSPESDDMLTLI